MGAQLTLVEPNQQVTPRLEELFKKFRLEHSVKQLVHESIESFNTEEKYDIAIAEGYLNILSTRNNMVTKMCGLMVPGGLGIISFDDTYGSLIELGKRVVIWRACELKGLENIQSQESLNVGKEFFLQDFERLSASGRIS